MKKQRKTEKKSYWIKFVYSECVLCGSREDRRERRYDKKPKDPHARHEFVQYACGHHFS